MRARLTILAGGAAAAAAAAYELVRRRAPAPAPEPDDRAAELRQKLADSREVVRERDEYEAGETPVDAVEDVEERRREVHERGRGAVEQMRSEGP